MLGTTSCNSASRFSSQIAAKPSDAGNVLLGLVQAGDNAGFYRIGAIGENDRNGFGRCLRGKGRRTSADRGDDRDVKIINEVRRQHRQSIALPLGPAESDVYVAPPHSRSQIDLGGTPLPTRLIR
jgi:hypothetical protein